MCLATVPEVQSWSWSKVVYKPETLSMLWTFVWSLLSQLCSGGRCEERSISTFRTFCCEARGPARHPSMEAEMWTCGWRCKPSFLLTEKCDCSLCMLATQGVMMLQTLIVHLIKSDSSVTSFSCGNDADFLLISHPVVTVLPLPHTWAHKGLTLTRKYVIDKKKTVCPSHVSS